MPREVVISLAFIAVLLGAVGWFYWPHVGGARSHRLGQELLAAAEDHEWGQVQALLDEGADPDVTELTPSQLYRHSHSTLRDLIEFFSPHPAVPAAALKREPALAMAISQKNFYAVKMLLAHHATISPAVLAVCPTCGDRALMTYVEDAAHVLPNKRSVATAPFTAAASSPREIAMTTTGGAGPVSHYLWLSPHELLLERGGTAPTRASWPRAVRPGVMPAPTPGTPPSFFAFDLNTQAETPLPDLTHAWSDQPEFDPDMLALSPDGQWLLGFGGTADHPTWRATQVHGSGVQEWDRVAEKNPKKRFWIGAHPLIAWRDNTRWLEINQPGPEKVVRLRALGSPATQELPVKRGGYGYINGFNNSVFTCTDPDHAFLRGNVGVTSSRENGPQYVLFMAQFSAGPDGWTEEKRGFNVSSANQPGSTQRCVPSPDGKRLAWLQVFANGLARDILLTDADGSRFRVVQETLIPGSDYMRGHLKFPSSRSLDWTPDSTKLIYWRGEKGEDGLCLLPIGAEE